MKMTVGTISIIIIIFSTIRAATESVTTVGVEQLQDDGDGPSPRRRRCWDRCDDHDLSQMAEGHNHSITQLRAAPLRRCCWSG